MANRAPSRRASTSQGPPQPESLIKVLLRKKAPATQSGTEPPALNPATHSTSHISSTMHSHPSTPHKASSDHPHGFEKVEHIHDALEGELSNCWFTTSGPGTTTISEMFPLHDIRDAPTAIKNFIHKYKGYKSKQECWTCIPEQDNNLKEADLYAPYVKLIQGSEQGSPNSRRRRKPPRERSSTPMPLICHTFARSATN